MRGSNGLVALFLFASLLAIFGPACAQDENSQGSKCSHGGCPNVLLIMYDDLRPELSVYGQNVKTPNFERLAAKSMVFDRTYVQGVCQESGLTVSRI